MQGYIYPNEYELQWSLLIVLYPYITGLVAGAFILASLERVFNVRAVRPTYRLALLTAFAFLLVAPLPLQMHLGHPERSWEILVTPNRKSAMAMFGFVYAWYLMVVLLLEIWFEYRKDLVLWSRTERGFKRLLHRVLTLGATDLSERSLRFDDSAGRLITLVGIPSAFLLHGYVGFIFGSVKANPWWSSVLMPVVFIFSAIVSGIALVLILYVLSSLIRRTAVDMKCLDKLGTFLFHAMVVDLSLELLDFIHRLYESEESIGILSQMIQNRLFISLIVLQLLLGSLVPLVMLGLTSPALRKEPIVRVSDELKRLIFVGSALLVEVGILSIRWNVVIGGQLFSKSLRGLTVYKMELFGLEGLAVTIALLVLPFLLLWVLVKVLPPWLEAEAQLPGSAAPGVHDGVAPIAAVNAPGVELATPRSLPLRPG